MQQQIREFPATTVPVQEDGWLSLDGIYYPCGYCHHADAAEEIAGASVYELEKRGWVHISDSYPYREKELTQAQQDTLFDMLMLDTTSVMATYIAPLINIRL